MYLRTRHTSFYVPWPLMIIVGPLWLSVWIMVLAVWGLILFGKGLIWLIAAIAAAIR